MNDLVYMPSVLKHFRRLAEEWRAIGRERWKTVKNMEKMRNSGEIDYGYFYEIRELTIEAEMYEAFGKELKELVSDVRNNKVGIL